MLGKPHWAAIGGAVTIHNLLINRCYSLVGAVKHKTMHKTYCLGNILLWLFENDKYWMTDVKKCRAVECARKWEIEKARFSFQMIGILRFITIFLRQSFLLLVFKTKCRAKNRNKSIQPSWFVQWQWQFQSLCLCLTHSIKCKYIYTPTSTRSCTHNANVNVRWIS